MQGLARFARWVLRSPEPVAQRTGSAVVDFDYQDPGRPSCQPPDIWRAASARGARGSGDCLLSQHRRQADAHSADCADGRTHQKQTFNDQLDGKLR